LCKVIFCRTLAPMDRDFEIARRTEELVLGLGTNVGDKSRNLSIAIRKLEEVFGPVLDVSRVYLTAPWGKTDQDDFLNQVAVFETNIRPSIALDTIMQIEEEMGRVRFEKWGPRLIDIDILLYGQIVYQSDLLQIPHPYIQDRVFVLDPLAEIRPDFNHPLHEKSVRTLLQELQQRDEQK